MKLAALMGQIDECTVVLKAQIAAARQARTSEDPVIEPAPDPFLTAAPSELDELIQTKLDALGAVLDELHKDKADKSTITRTVVTVAAVILVMLLVGGFIAHRISDRSYENGMLLQRMAAESVRVDNLTHQQCSLFGLIIPSYRVESRAVSPLGPQGYDQAYLKMQQSSDALKCGIQHAVPGS